jgi:TatD DNase family protein
MIDSHCHLADAVFVDDLADVVARAQAAGVTSALCILSADEADEVARAEDVRATWPDVRFAAGVHPHRAGAFAGAPTRAADIAGQSAADVNVVAIGEIGLDYHYDFAPRAVQRDVFAVQAALAASRSLPVVIHTREAADDTMDVLRATPSIRGVMHCFTGTRDEARRALDLGFYLSMSGIVTFPRSAELRDVAAFVPADRLLIETDAPFLAPVPHRGKRNEPAWIGHTCDAVAAIRGTTARELGILVAKNFEALFGPAR